MLFFSNDLIECHFVLKLGTFCITTINYRNKIGNWFYEKYVYLYKQQLFITGAVEQLSYDFLTRHVLFYVKGFYRYNSFTLTVTNT